jgi:preprotein translocase subunit YajC
MSRHMDAFWFSFQDPAPPAPPAPPPPASTGQPADSGAPQPQPSGGGLQTMLVPLVLMFVVFYFLMLRPQRKQQKERELMISNLKKNDKVITSFGLYGIVKQVKPEDPDIVLCIDENKDVRIRVSKASVATLEKASGGDSEPKPETPKEAKS